MSAANATTIIAAADATPGTMALVAFDFDDDDPFWEDADEVL